MWCHLYPGPQDQILGSVSKKGNSWLGGSENDSEPDHSEQTGPDWVVPSASALARIKVLQEPDRDREGKTHPAGWEQHLGWDCQHRLIDVAPICIARELSGTTKRLGLPGLLAVLFMATTLMTSWATPTGCDGTPGYLRTTEENISMKDDLLSLLAKIKFKVHLITTTKKHAVTLGNICQNFKKFIYLLFQQFEF